MSVALDASSPIRFTATGSSPFSATSAAFTAPTGSVLTACPTYNDSDGQAHGSAITDSVGDLTWTLRTERAAEETPTGGEASIWTAIVPSAVSRTVTAAWSGTATSPPRRVSCKVDAWTGVDINGTPFDTVGANNESGTNATNDYTTPSLTPGATGVLLVNAMDWNALTPGITSSNLTLDAVEYSGESCDARGYRTCTSGVALTANLNAGGASAPHFKECRIIIREAPPAGGSAVLTGTAVGGITEADVVAGGKVITVTLTGDTFIT